MTKNDAIYFSRPRTQVQSTYVALVCEVQKLFVSRNLLF
jgi:hypothetical protein